MKSIKRILILVLLIALAAPSLASCGSENSLARFELSEIGLSLALPKTFRYEEYSQRGVYATYINERGSCAVLVHYFENESLLQNEGFGGDISLENYIDYSLRVKYGIKDVEVEYNSKGNAATFSFLSAESENEEPQFNYFCVIKSDKAIYLVQMICSATDSEFYEEEFERWNKEFSIDD